MTEGIHITLDDELAILTIDRQSNRNALDAKSISDFVDAVAHVEANDAITAMAWAFVAVLIAECEPMHCPWGWSCAMGWLWDGTRLHKPNLT